MIIPTKILMDIAVEISFISLGMSFNPSLQLLCKRQQRAAKCFNM